MKLLKQFAGKWRIVEMEMWDQDYVDMEVPGYIEIGSGGIGRFQFGLISGGIDGRVDRSGKSPRFEFSWAGQDENDPHSGRGWAVIADNVLRGRIFFHFGDDSGFKAFKKRGK